MRIINNIQSSQTRYIWNWVEMSSKALHSSEILKKALFDLPGGMPVSMEHLKEFGISRQLTHYYVQSGWFEKLGSGYYLRAGDKLTEMGAVASLQESGIKVHIGGKSALALKGFVHYVSMGGETLSLYGQGIRQLPAWFEELFKVVLSKSTLFDEQNVLAKRLGVSRLDNAARAPYVSEPERAVLELLDLIPKNQTLDEAKQIMEVLQSLRAKKMQDLLMVCNKIKVKRLFWMLGDELSLPVMKKLNCSEIDFGSKSAYILHGEKNVALRNPNG